MLQLAAGTLARQVTQARGERAVESSELSAVEALVPHGGDPHSTSAVGARQIQAAHHSCSHLPLHSAQTAAQGHISGTADWLLRVALWQNRHGSVSHGPSSRGSAKLATLTSPTVSRPQRRHQVATTTVSRSGCRSTISGLRSS